MLDDISACKDLAADGVVLGCLDKSGKVDKQACHQLITHAKQLVSTYL
jgi:copper homeostasis protein CutC